jgi:hypothetical protein
MKSLLPVVMALSMTGCGNDSNHPMTLKLQPVPHPLIDNLFVATAKTGATSSLGGAAGRFSIRNRCLVVNTDGVDRTPVFSGNVDVTEGGLVVAGRTYPYGSTVSLPMIGPPVRVAGLQNASCPREAVAIRSIGEG